MLLEKTNIIYSFQNQNFHIPDSVIIKKDFYWKADDKDDQPVLEFRFKKKVLFDRLVLQENIRNGQRIERFVLEINQNGKWVPVAEGQTVGHKRILRFEPVETQRMRIRFPAFRGAPELIHAGVYLSPDV